MQCSSISQGNQQGWDPHGQSVMGPVINLRKWGMPQSGSFPQREKQWQTFRSMRLELRMLPHGPDQIILLLLLSWNSSLEYSQSSQELWVHWDISNRAAAWYMWSTFALLYNILFWCVLSISHFEFGDHVHTFWKEGALFRFLWEPRFVSLSLSLPLSLPLSLQTFAHESHSQRALF